ncbi:MAG: nuclear transport factor 2 family protein [Ignavibacteriaceae bacterium]|jgi:hypothetical protein|nr:nuclear transport factor 2 family protein [Ignavibacteriaceae bacterium]MCW8812134.1 nuclear transport factor 2 family protein [Chlorobium sp.]MCW8817651.1 nuclear transport factor 2 family protein [Ignavibacteriaceae bacterium]MCW8994575.1 nuclear transport factor 2 family protein [Psychromonas sp.]MCW9094760.1 nuclear transport factor 2 family protein [Ignavibacteriaceae bacterium]
MKLIIYLLFPLFLFMHLSAQDKEENERIKLIEEEKIWSLEEEYISYFKEANHEAILSFYHSQFLGWPDSELHPADKEGAAKYLAERYPEPTQVDYEIKREGIRILDNIVITYYLLNFSWINDKGVKQTSASRMTHTWIKDGSEWKILGGMSNRE